MPDIREGNLAEMSPPDEGPEIIIGLVGAVAAGLDDAVRQLEAALKSHGYDVETDSLHLSDRIEEVPELLDETELTDEPEDQRIRSLQQEGNEVRRKLGRNDALALLTCLNIREYRKEQTGSPWKQVPQQAYILTSLKTPTEAETLRSIYGAGFVLAAVYAPTQLRHDRLAERIARDRRGIENYETGDDEEIDRLASEIIEIDRYEAEEEYGQNVRDTFPKADVFLDATDPDELREQVERSVDLLFGAPFETPTRDEQCMYIAEAARLRSAALGRQVGAALAKPEGEVVSIGCNDAPRAGGGLYWPDHDHDNRDFQLSRNLSREKRLETLQGILRELDGMNALQLDQLDLDTDELEDVDLEELNDLMTALDDTRLSSLIEFYRATHAEMEAVLSASRKGIPVEGATLYGTTFPCHECTRHIIAAGLDRVVYIEPYPKSLGQELHGDAVSVEGKSPAGEVWKRTDAREAPKVNYEPFVGIGPRIYDHVFQAGKRKVDGQIADWPPKNPDPIFGITHSGWWIDETLELRDIESKIERASSL